MNNELCTSNKRKAEWGKKKSCVYVPINSCQCQVNAAWI